MAALPRLPLNSPGCSIPPELMTQDSHYNPENGNETQRVNGMVELRDEESQTQPVTRVLSMSHLYHLAYNHPIIKLSNVTLQRHKPFPIALVNLKLRRQVYSSSTLPNQYQHHIYKSTQQL
ncbi:IQ calmodulin-binding motif protein [Aspergillus tanneri]|uniref:Uncharacterized protein n=1 Tax=Aspergillus tanneri TaxID=1220188 RepID=A0A5M9MEE2_9EURO|nr:uncharacterized protein ATNIH1004_008314 [Aspergillus tanneri]KAA8644116.1 hypothetical protein ATNIH1004_008314 [Aspergillus tanneri]